MRTPNMNAEKIGKNKLRLNIYDQIGPSWMGMIDGKLVADALAEAGPVKEIEVHINSVGGSVFEGVAIYNILKDHPAKVRMKVDGLAASSASVVLMAGDEIEVPRNAPVMIHNPETFAAGGQAEMQRTADFLGKVRDSIVDTYAARTKKPAAELIAMMDAETWMYGDEAVKHGFADRVSGELKIAPVAEPSNLATTFRNAPENLFSLVALASGIQRSEEKKMAEPTKQELEAAQAKITADAVEAAKVEAVKQAEVKAAADKAVSDARDAERNRGAEINSLCLQAGKPELAAKFIGDGATIADVQSHLLKVLCQDRKPVDDGGEGGSQTTDENAAYKAEYAKNKAEYAKAGMTEEQFVSMRRIDDGKDTLVK